MRGGGMVPRWAHNPEYASSNLVPATSLAPVKRMGRDINSLPAVPRAVEKLTGAGPYPE